jgi:hypothetical protein
MDNPKIFSESEVADVMRRAAQLQEEQSETGYTPGVTSDELRRIAAEAGIDPKFLDRAILERSQAPLNKNKLMTVEKVLPVELSPENFDAITEKVTPLMSSSPQTGTSMMTQIGRSLQGQVKAGWSNPHIKVSSREGRTKMSVTAEPSVAAAMGLLWITPSIVVGVAAAQAHPVLGWVAATACMVAGFFNYRWGVRKANEATQKVAVDIESAIMEAGTVRENLASATAVQLEADSDSVKQQA